LELLSKPIHRAGHPTRWMARVAAGIGTNTEPLNLMNFPKENLPMKKLAVAVAMIFLTVGCRQDGGTKSPTSGAPSQSETPGSPKSPTTPSQQQSTSGGGVDSSGGDLLTSSNEQVDKSIQDIENKTHDVIYRMGTELIRAEKTDFEEKFGEDSYALVRDFLTAEGKLNLIPRKALQAKKIQFDVVATSCEGDQQEKAGSASWIREQPVVCLSRQHLSKMSPESLQLDTVALAVHEMAHLYGFEESKARALQAFVVRNKALVWPDQEFMKELVSTSDDSLALVLNLIVDFKAKRDLKLCSSADGILREVMRILKTRENHTSVVIPAFATNVAFFVPVSLEGIQTACEASDLAAVRKAVAKELPGIFEQTLNLNTVLRVHANPTAPGAFYPTFDFMSLLSAFEEPEIMANSYAKANPRDRIEMEDVFCSFQELDPDFSNEFSKPYTVPAHQFYGDKTEGLGKMARPENGEQPYMLRRVKGQRGLGFAIMSEKIKIIDSENLTPTNGGGGATLYATSLLPGVSNDFQFEAMVEKRTIRVRCGYKDDGKMPDLTYKLKPKRDKSAKDINDTYFMKKPKKSLQLKIKLNVPGKNDVTGGPELPTTEVETIRYNGHITLKAVNGERCIIQGPYLREHKVDAEKLAIDLREGKYSEVTCEMNGQIRNDGNAAHAAWIFAYSVK
jgi:hypothetical protein